MLLSPGPQIPSLFYPQSFKISFVPGWWIIRIQIPLLATTVRTLFVCLRCLQPDSPVGLFNSGTLEALARRRWYIYVCFPSLLCLSQDFTFRALHPLHLDGNSLLPLTMSGTSFEGVAHSDGQYGSVAFSQVSPPPTHKKVLISTCFRFTQLRA